ncbi:MAG TPA: hypothetical protein VEQ18_04210 [Candidatus Nitrosocosmicus sp.]|nr:hypothetical protein [Candidatus Nitrosocosmicus sp.]
MEKQNKLSELILLAQIKLQNLYSAKVSAICARDTEEINATKQAITQTRLELLTLKKQLNLEIKDNADS